MTEDTDKTGASEGAVKEADKKMPKQVDTSIEQIDDGELPQSVKDQLNRLDESD